MSAPYAAVPVDLREVDRWVVWKIERRDDKVTKVPYWAARPTARASSTEPATWAPFARAVQAAQCPSVDGIGFVFVADDDLVGVDLDHCVVDGVLHPEAQRIVADLGCGYAELSPSGEGVHIIVRARLTGTRNRTTATPWGDRLEIYDQGRYFTVTGNSITGAAEITDAQDALDALIARLLPPEPAAVKRNGGVSAATRPDTPAGARRRDDERAEKLLARYDVLARTVAHKSSSPGDGSMSAWDFALGCRAAELELSDDDLYALIALHRERHNSEKGWRVSYIHRTITKVRERVGYPAHDPEEILPRLTAWLLATDPAQRSVVGIEVAGDDDDASAVLLLSDGSAIRFARLGDVAEPRRLRKKLSSAVGVVSAFSEQQATEICALIRRYVGPAEQIAEFERVAGIVEELLEAAPTTVDWAVLMTANPGVDARTPEDFARAVPVVIDAAGTRYIKAGWMQDFIARRGGPREGWVNTLGLLGIRQQQPRVGAARPRVYAVPADWSGTPRHASSHADHSAGERET